MKIKKSFMQWDYLMGQSIDCRLLWQIIESAKFSVNCSNASQPFSVCRKIIDDLKNDIFNTKVPLKLIYCSSIYHSEYRGVRMLKSLNHLLTLFLGNQCKSRQRTTHFLCRPGSINLKPFCYFHP